MSLFRNDGPDDGPDRRSSAPPQRRQPSTGAPFSLRNRSVYFWLNIGFVVIVVGMLVGATNDSWFFVVAVLWIAISVVVAVRSSRNRPRPPNLFEDQDDHRD